MFRVTIAGFVLGDESEAAITGAMTDVLLLRSRAEVVRGGIDAATARYADGEGTPEMLLVESDGDAATLRESLDRLSGLVSPNTRVVVVGRVDSIEFYREIMDLGVSQYLLAPLTREGVLRAVRDAFGSERAIERGRVIAVFGAKGGCGASSVAQNIAWSLARIQDRPVSLIDVGLHFGSVGMNYNHDNRFGLRDALIQVGSLGSIEESFLERLFSKESDSLWLLASAPSLLDASGVYTPENLDAVVDASARMADFVVLDMPHHWDPAAASVLLSADEVLVVSEPTLHGLRCTQMVFETVGPNKPANTFLRYLVNMSGVDRATELGAKDFSEAVGSAPMAVLPWMPAAFRASSLQGRMLGDVKGTAKLVATFDDLARRLSGRKETAEAPRAGLLASLFGKGSKASKKKG